MIECLECGEEFKSFGSLSKHVSFHHRLTSQEYYTKHYGKGKCCVCDADTKFVNISIGYNTTCSHRCGAIKHRDDMRKDPEKFDQFRKKVSSNMVAVHANMNPEIKAVRMSKVIEAARLAVSAMSPEQRKQAFGWMNKLNDEEKRQAVSAMLEVGTHRWWREATDDMKQEVYHQRAETLRNTWDKHGVEIMKKQSKTFSENSSNFHLSDQDIELANKALCEIFNT